MESIVHRFFSSVHYFISTPFFLVELQSSRQVRETKKNCRCTLKATASPCFAHSATTVRDYLFWPCCAALPPYGLVRTPTSALQLTTYWYSRKWLAHSVRDKEGNPAHFYDMGMIALWLRVTVSYCSSIRLQVQGASSIFSRSVVSYPNMNL